MHPLKPPPDSVLARAAEVRAEGNCWRVVAEAVHRAEETVRRWPARYPDRWAEAMRAAARRAIDDAAAEGMFMLRNLVRTGEEDVRLKAAWHLMYQRLEIAKLEAREAARLPPPPPSDAQLIAKFVEAHTHDQLIQLATSLLNAQVPKRIRVSGDDAACKG